MATTDPVGTALASIAAGSTTGAAAIALGALFVRHGQQQGASTPDPATGATVLLGGVFLGVVLAAGTGWALTRAIDDVWRRGVTAAISVFGAVLLSLLALPADMAAGRVGILMYVVALVVASFVAHHTARRNAAQ